MKLKIDEIVNRNEYSRQDIIRLLTCHGEDAERLFKRAAKLRRDNLGNKVYLRGLIELSNTCQKNCLYCGIRKDNKHTERYSMTVEEILVTARDAFKQGFSSLVLQSGEIQSPSFTRRITQILKGIRELSDGRIHVTLSCGEQSSETYAEWLDAGAHRYLLRIESSDRQLYESIHPQDGNHSYDTRLSKLEALRNLGYQTGTGVMIGLPGQSIGQLADDLLFFREFDIDMIGMGPYVEHHDSPLFNQSKQLWPDSERFEMTRKMVAVLRLMMPDINIAATTASEALVPQSREMLIASGANVIMPNISPVKYQGNYDLYSNKPNTHYNKNGDFKAFASRVNKLGYLLVPEEWGDSQHFHKKCKDCPV